MTSTLEDLDSCIMEARKVSLKGGAAILLGIVLVTVLWSTYSGGRYLVPIMGQLSSMACMAGFVLVVQDYYEWHRNLERSKKIIRNSVNFLYYIEKSSTWDQTPSLVPAHILATWLILQLELDYMARRPRWNPFRYK
jgi:UDP-N-acetylmuramyl pentapeptide phosphotransferase/UDP-N-acetylglucosamine-1-phosphate transferase